MLRTTAEFFRPLEGRQFDDFAAAENAIRIRFNELRRAIPADYGLEDFLGWAIRQQLFISNSRGGISLAMTQIPTSSAVAD